MKNPQFIAKYKYIPHYTPAYYKMDQRVPKNTSGVSQHTIPTSKKHIEELEKFGYFTTEYNTGFPRWEKTWHPVGVVLAVKNSDGDVRIGWSSCQPEDQFKKKTAIKLALAQALSEEQGIMPEALCKVIDLEYIERVQKYFRLEHPPILPHVYTKSGSQLVVSNITIKNRYVERELVLAGE